MAVPSWGVGARYCAPVLTNPQVFLPGGVWRDNEKSEQVSALYSDSSNAIQKAHKHWVSPRLRHIKTAYHFFKQYVLSGDVKLSHVSGTQNVADILTKGFGSCGPHQSNQKGPEFRGKALEAPGHVKCEDNCTGQATAIYYFY